jgi:hypothetical protein
MMPGFADIEAAHVRPKTADRRQRLRCVGLALLLLIAALLPAQAHRSGPGRTDGLPIDSLSHGQMVVIDNNRAAVFALATRAIESDEAFRRLFNYAKIQRTVCLWGVVPGSVTDESNPFNGCAHAYLAATRALLTQLRDRAAADAAASALADKVDHELLLEGTLALCVYSGDAYNTADLIYPDWSAIPGHPPTVLACGGLVSIIAAASALLASRRRVSPRQA